MHNVTLIHFFRKQAWHNGVAQHSMISSSMYQCFGTDVVTLGLSLSYLRVTIIIPRTTVVVTLGLSLLYPELAKSSSQSLVLVSDNATMNSERNSCSKVSIVPIAYCVHRITACGVACIVPYIISILTVSILFIDK